jgi:predicted TIM-barrel fold metal-dependent hydrolase
MDTMMNIRPARIRDNIRGMWIMTQAIDVFPSARSMTTPNFPVAVSSRGFNAVVFVFAARRGSL